MITLLEHPIVVSNAVLAFIRKQPASHIDNEDLCRWTSLYGLEYLAKCLGTLMPVDEYGDYNRLPTEIEEGLLPYPMSLWNYMVVRKHWFRQHRWAEAESIFLALPYYAANYANTFLQARWPAFEILLGLNYHGRAKAYAGLYESAMVAIEEAANPTDDGKSLES